MKPPEKKPPPARAKAQDDIGVTFVNRVMARGCWAGVANVTLGTFNFTPFREGPNVDEDLVVSCRLRLDMLAVKELRDALDWVIAKMEGVESNIPERIGYDDIGAVN